MKNQTIAVVGSTGKTGVRVLGRLRSLGHQTRGLARSGEVPFDWSDKQTWSSALNGVQSVYVTYYPDLVVPQAEHDIRVFVQLAKEKGVKHIVLLSGRGEEGAQRAEDVVKASGLTWNIVRASWFMQNFSESFMLDGLKQGELLIPEPKSSEPFIDIDDIADVVVAALTRSELRNQLLEVTGPELLSFADCVQNISLATERNIRLTTLPVESYLAAGKAEGLPEDIVWLMNELFENVLDGRNASTTNTVEKVLGRPARSFTQYLGGLDPEVTWGRV